MAVFQHLPTILLLVSLHSGRSLEEEEGTTLKECVSVIIQKAWSARMTCPNSFTGGSTT